MAEVEIFNTTDFTKALEAVLDADRIYELGIVGDELRFRYVVNNFDGKTVNIDINSSIQHDGLSADTGENSIRAWICGQDGKPLGSKTQKWVTREPGWQKRLGKMLSGLSEMAEQISVCPDCKELEKIFIAKTEANKGRKFKKCGCGNFQWLDDEVDDVTDTPKCPKCNAAMVLRKSKWGKFYGCSKYPKCKSTRTVDNYTKALAENSDNADSPQVSYKDAVAAIADAKKVIKNRKFVPSEYQQRIFKWVKEYLAVVGKHLVVRATAGSGKTTTILQLLQFTRGKDVLFLAFNKAIQTELAKRAPSHVDVLTFHALGFSACREAFELDKDAVDNSKVYKLFREVVDWTTHRSLYPAVSKLVSLIKANLVGTTDDELSDIASYYGIELNGDYQVIFDITRAVFDKSVKMTNSIDFDDMCYLPIYYDLPMKQYDVLCCDETQDMNRNQIALALKSIKPTGNVIAVGDENQSLYGFRGASVDAMDNVISALNADELPLSITYRCPKSHVRFVNQLFPDIVFEQWDENIEGKILEMSINRAMVEWKDGDMVLCRTNAPLVEPCFALIRRGVKATIRGKDIGKGLIDLIQKMDCSGIDDLLVSLREYSYREVEKLRRMDKNAQAVALQDKINTVVALTDGVYTINALEVKIADVFSDKIEGVVFSTIHKAKGLEAECISILRPELLPHPAAKQAWEIKQETHAAFVVYTRSKDVMIFVR